MKQDYSLAALGVVLIVAIAGRAGPDTTAPVVGLEKMADTTEVADTTSRQLIDLVGGNEAPRAHKREETIKQAIENHTSERTISYVETDKPVEYQGAYYEINREQISDIEVVHILINATRTQARQTAEYRLSELPPTHKKLVRAATDHPQRTLIQRYALKERNHSVLLKKANSQRFTVSVSSPDRGTAEGSSAQAEVRAQAQAQIYLINLTDGQRGTQPRYAYSSVKKANNSEAYGEVIIEQYGFKLTNTSPATDRLLQTAINGGYYGYGEQNETINRTLDRFRQHEEKLFRKSGSTRIWFVTYQGDLYKAKLRYYARSENN